MGCCLWPKALSSAGRVGDGLVLQIAEPTIVKWLADQAKKAGVEAGRDMSDYKVMVAAPAYTGPVDKAIEAVRWFPAMVGTMWRILLKNMELIMMRYHLV